MFLFGSAGTGKTLILIEALKIKLSELLSQGRKVRILVTTFTKNESELQKIMISKYLVHMENIEVMSLGKLCRELEIKYDRDTPRDTINRVITSLSDKYREADTVTLLLVDEVSPCYKFSATPDWRHLQVRENVIWLLGLNPRAWSASSTTILPPLNNSVLSRHLVMKHRNCPQIRNSA